MSDQTDQQPAKWQPPMQMVLPMPSSGSGIQWAYIELPGRMTEEGWEYLMNLLDVMKPGTVKAPSVDEVES